MEWINEAKVLIVGLGLIGGSYARALKRLGFCVYAIDTDPDAIAYALEEKMIDKGATDDSLLPEADCIILALYPSLVKDWIDTHQDRFKSGVIITDVTGIKSAIVYDVQKILRKDAEFIAAHPMAGRETSGVWNSTDRIFRDANYIVVPTQNNSEEAIRWCKNLGRVLGFEHISILSPKEHDSMIAYVSQLTHCIAVALMTCEDNEHLKDYTGDSFRDLTRIANINEEMWTELFFLNRQPLLDRLDTFIEELRSIRDLIDQEDEEGLKEKMRLSTKRRAMFDEK